MGGLLGKGRLSALAVAVLMSGSAFRPQHLFGSSEPGVHFETYDPNTILARRNRLTYSSDFTNAAYTRVAVLGVTSNADGTGDLVVPTTANSQHYVSQGNCSIGVSNTCTVRAKQGGYSWLGVQIGGQLGLFDLATGALGGASAGVTHSITAVGNGYYDCTVTGVPTTSTMALIVCNGNTSAAFAADGTSGVYLARAQLEWNTTTASEYQEVTDWNTEYMAAALESIGMWQDSTGTTPVTGVEQPVGLWWDRKRGFVFGADVKSLGTVQMLGTATAATYDTTTGAGSSTRVDASNQSYVQFSSLTTNSNYRLRITNTGSVSMLVRANNSGGATLATITAGASHPVTVSTAGITIITLTASAAGTATFTLTALQEAPGNHATQATSGSRPTLSARVNMIVKSEQLADASWTKVAAGTGTAPACTDNYSGAAAPDGTFTASRVVLALNGGTTLTDQSVLTAPFTVQPTGASCRFRFYVKANGVGQVGKAVVTRQVAGAVYTMLTLTADWQLVEYSESQGAAVTGLSIVGLRGTTGSSDSADLLIWHPDLRTANDAALNIPAYQRVNTSTDYDTDGFPHRVKGDGVDDFMSFPLDLTGTDAVVFWLGHTKNGDAAAQVAFELSANAGTTAGAMAVYAPSTISTGSYLARSRGTSSSDANAAGYGVPHSAVLTVSADISDDTLTLDVDGTQAATSSTDQGTGNYGNHTGYLWARAGTSLRSTGALTSFTLRGAATTASQKVAMNRYTARKLGKNI